MRILLFLPLLLLACNLSTEKPAEKHIILLPEAGLNSCAYSGSEFPYLLNPMLYIGKWTDTIEIEKAYKTDTIYSLNSDSHDSDFFCFPRLIGPKDHIYSYEELLFNPSVKDSVTITIDTSSNCQSRHWLYSNEPTDTCSYKACPVIITNTGKDTLFLYGLRIYVQVKQKDGKWKRVSLVRTPVDHTGDPYYYCAPGELIVTAVPLFSGTTPARFRLLLQLTRKEFYSDEYSGTVNPLFIK